MLLMTDKHKFHSHFFILPFRCDKCGNTFMFEHGLRRYIEGNGWLERMIFPEDSMMRYCSICSVEIIEREEEK